MPESPQIPSPDITPTLPAGTPITMSDLTTLVDETADGSIAHPLAEPGMLLDGVYRVLNVKGGPGVSGMGVVYIVEMDEGRFAAKTFQHQFSQNLPLVERFLRESRTWLLTGFHPNIVHAYFIDIIDAAPYLFMEYVESADSGNLSLADYLKSGCIDMPDAVRLGIQCCDGMIHAVSAVPGLVHRDLKPENLLIARDGTLKITDFGLVRCNISEDIPFTRLDELSDRTELTQAGTTFGTPAYMAPEQFLEAATVGEAADIYAFGCCFYEAISGNRLFTIRAGTALEHLMALREFHQHEPPIPLLERVEDCPQDLNRVIMRCLEKRPEDRWSSFRELRDELIFIYENAFSATYRIPRKEHESAREVARQIRSLTLLDGYQRAVRLRNLREHQEASPYAFHLALASYFLATGETDEERRQLEKALRVREPGQGYEAVRRLAELHLDAGESDQAENVLNLSLAEDPSKLERYLEPLVRLLTMRGNFADAKRIVSNFPPGRRTEALLAHVYQAAGQTEDLAALYRRQVDELVCAIRQNISEVTAGDRVGWEHQEDPGVLHDVMRELAPDCSLEPLDRTEHAVWPDLDAYPDFSVPMAWL
ncbi:MAG: protein kinase [Candidatus Hydrogenedentes bacterium]|nr:protein kinase [Candidatus Hydrogenedentota bacterium]